MRVKLYHGTAPGTFTKVNNKGFSNSNPVWSVSGDYVYFFLEMDNNLERGVKHAMNSGQISSALKFSKKNYVEVFELEVDEIFFVSYFEKDNSTNGTLNGAVKIKTDDLNRLIESEIVTMHKHKYYVYERQLAPFILRKINSKKLLQNVNKELLQLYKNIKEEKIGSVKDINKSKLFILDAMSIFKAYNKQGVLELYEQVREETFVKYLDNIVLQEVRKIPLPTIEDVEKYKVLLEYILEGESIGQNSIAATDIKRCNI